jgi:cellulose synthase (UDP-forming)
MVLLVLLGVLGVLAYCAFLLNPANRGDLLPYLFVVVTEAIIALSALLSMWTILSGGFDPRDFSYNQTKSRLLKRTLNQQTGRAHQPWQWPMRLGNEPVSVDVFITTYGEDPATIWRTVFAAMRMHGEHRTLVLDDGRSEDVRRIADELGAIYITRPDNTDAKAGNVNHALSLSNAEFFVILDADFVPKENFLVETMPFFAKTNVAFVQTPQTYGNLRTFMSRGAGYMQTVFYRLILPGRNRFNAAFCVGTNVVFRRAAIDQVGGIYTKSKSEDVWTSLLLHEAGWRSIFLPLTLAIGDAPETIGAWSRQQLRWATGSFEILLGHNPLSRKRTLTLDQRLQYLGTATHYLTGICPALLLFVPPLEIYFDLRPVNTSVTPETWALYYAGFYVMQIGLAFYAVGSFKVETLLLSSVAFPIYVKALTNVLLGRKTTWKATGAKSAVDSPFNYIVPQMLMFLFLALTSVVGVWRDLDNGVLTLATAWNVTNGLVLLVFIGGATRESHVLRLQARAERRANRAIPGRHATGPVTLPAGSLASQASEAA